ncbi:MAG TPA: hypothetical protein PLJ04_03125 [Candidatus Saccharibacteria bacterium]|nr:hypothetical protein [Candidatus Saccharibacteria bacterium]MCB9816984.1 hypothetical protein [Candidatus Nomurabacteria bacterium]HPD98892.1 hypothetical protein [Candidatus Saccharibacteria bacterium]HPR10549.1 hypothetical protein [Candidatus Saccharibacteria bacterium]
MSIETIPPIGPNCVDTQDQTVVHEPIAPQRYEELDEVALYFLWENEEKRKKLERQRKELARWFKLEETASWEEINYHVELANAERLETVRLGRLALYRKERYVVPGQEELDDRLSKILSDRFWTDQNPTRRLHLDQHASINHGQNY